MCYDDSESLRDEIEADMQSEGLNEDHCEECGECDGDGECADPDFDGDGGDEGDFDDGDDYAYDDFVDGDDELIDGVGFADPGGNSALRAATPNNPRNLPCPTCGRANMLTPADVARHYQCDHCADQAERGW